ncbi:MAG TPA: hypothetical protein VIX90_15225 [Edaphobacter sp.]
MTKTGYGRLTVGLIAAWFVLSLMASAFHMFSTSPDKPPLPLLIAVVVPITVFWVWYRTSTSFKAYVLSLNPRTLTIIHSWRIAGFVFLVLYTYGILPGVFALPAGWGDIAIGATALLVGMRLSNPRHKRSFIAWQLLGVTDLVAAITLGAAARFIEPQAGLNGITTSPMTVLPLSLIPTFAVPFLLILHMICIAQAVRWSEQRDGGIGQAEGSLVA